MSATDREERLFEAPPETQPANAAYETCEHCEAPVDATQRYCVVCGTRRKHVYDPAARFLSEATSRARVGSRRAASSPSRTRRSAGLLAALVLAAIPLAVAAGLLIGRRGDGVPSSLLAALRAEKPPVVNINGGGSAAGAAATSATAGGGASATAAARLTSNFGLQQGYAVELQTLPGAGTTQATVATAEQHARTHGATAVGLISQADFRVTPAPAAGAYVIYSGQYRTSAQASAALTKLRHGFPAAKVISVRSVSVPAASGAVLSTTSYGSAHQVSGFKPSSSQLSSGAKVVNQVSKEINKGYVKSQQGLPDAISVP